MKALQNTLSLIKINTKIQKKTSQRKPTPNIESNYFISRDNKNLNSFALILRNLYFTESYLNQLKTNISWRYWSELSKWNIYCILDGIKKRIKIFSESSKKNWTIKKCIILYGTEKKLREILLLLWGQKEF